MPAPPLKDDGSIDEARWAWGLVDGADVCSEMPTRRCPNICGTPGLGGACARFGLTDEQAEKATAEYGQAPPQPVGHPVLDREAAALDISDW